MSALNFNTANTTFRQLIGNGISYNIPRFQRDYSWSSEEWDDLWQDILPLFTDDNEDDHYMGYLVLQTTDNKRFDVIDGQQRLTTISLLILAALVVLNRFVRKGIDPEGNRKRIDQFRDSYIGYVDPVTLNSCPKLVLNRHANRFYQQHLVVLEEITHRNLNVSEKQLEKGYFWFIDHLEKNIVASDNAGASLAGMIDRFVDKLLFTKITVNDELNAFKVFETLNSRGVRLSSTDLLKNYLFSVIDGTSQNKDSEMSALEEIWESITRNLDEEDFPTFLRVFWNSRKKLVNKAGLFKIVRKEIVTTEDVFTLVRGLQRCSEVYLALCNPVADSLWNIAEKRALQTLDLFGVRQPLPALLACYMKFFETERTVFERMLQAVVIFSFRYSVIGERNANELEPMYNKIACRITENECSTYRDIVSLMEDKYLGDDEFKLAFSKKELSTKTTPGRKKVRYVLSCLEKQVTGIEHNQETSATTVEHVLPQNPSQDWAHVSEVVKERMVYRLGNMALLEAGLNRDIENAGYEIKKPAYLRSSFQTTKKIAEEYDCWDDRKIQARQDGMARVATSVWRIDFAT